MTIAAVPINRFLLPLACLYGIAVWIRNRLFDRRILPATSFPLPVISIGNLAVGGTGKTPHTEYLIRLLKDNCRVAVLSRGYRRATSGFLLAAAGDGPTTSSDIGDEPYQIWQKFPNITVAVDSKRTRGIRQLLALPEDKRPEVILLDDAYQHRYVVPSLSLLLTDYHRLLFNDRLLPAGRLREPAGNISRAQIVVVTKCPEDLRPAERQAIAGGLRLHPGQTLFFSSLRYGRLLPVFRENPVREIAPETLKQRHTAVLLVTGIAHPEPLIDELSRCTERLQTMIYPDHHAFSGKDLLAIREACVRLDAEHKIIVTTEKDAARLANAARVPEALRNVLYYLPVEVTFHDEDSFKQIINTHVRSITRNRWLDSQPH
jgi:tetraacyldisaccharide 4'-kinase